MLDHNRGDGLAPFRPVNELEGTPAPESELITVKKPIDIRSIALTVLAGIAIVLLLQYAQAAVIPIVLGVLLSYALEPIVAWLQRRRVPRPLAAALVLVTLVGSTGWLLYSLRGQAAAIVNQLPEAAKRLRQRIEHDRPAENSPMQQVQKAATELEKAATAAAPAPPASGVQRVQVETAPIRISDYVMWGSMGVVAAAGQLVLILFLVFFLLASGDMYKRKLIKIVGPSLADKKLTLHLLAEIDRQIEMFLLVQVFTSTVVALATWLAFARWAWSRPRCGACWPASSTRSRTSGP